jgi:hydrogenase expression/formation protein HypC
MCLGLPGRVLAVHDRNGLRMGTVDLGGVRRPACLEYTPEARPGNYVIVHSGFAVSVVKPRDAAETYAILAQVTAAGGNRSSSPPAMSSRFARWRAPGLGRAQPDSRRGRRGCPAARIRSEAGKRPPRACAWLGWPPTAGRTRGGPPRRRRSEETAWKHAWASGAPGAAPSVPAAIRPSSVVLRVVERRRSLTRSRRQRPDDHRSRCRMERRCLANRARHTRQHREHQPRRDHHCRPPGHRTPPVPRPSHAQGRRRHMRATSGPAEP